MRTANDTPLLSGRLVHSSIGFDEKGDLRSAIPFVSGADRPFGPPRPFLDWIRREGRSAVRDSLRVRRSGGLPWRVALHCPGLAGSHPVFFGPRGLPGHCVASQVAGRSGVPALRLSETLIPQDARDLGLPGMPQAVLREGGYHFRGLRHLFGQVADRDVAGCELQQRQFLCRRPRSRSEEHTSELQSPCNLVCRLLLEKKKTPLAWRHVLTNCAGGRRTCCL